MSSSADSPNTTFDWPVRVYYEDTDAAGVVYYANYLRFMERGRTEWLRALGYEQDELREREGILFVVRSVSLDYLASARFNDRLTVTSSVPHHGGASLEFEQRIIRDADQTCCCRGRVKVASLDAATMRPKRMPAHLLSGILSGLAHQAQASME
ncbi:tol-pal system-associated acyl-CoA thioesterase [Thiorhodococcus minor]|uniref:Tol-pal system-associated acyl-CoA thioesterase n=1 Tax=Thiorhodococcus minor TaxID=57489 RepID=A0A6M0JYN4_9GAMM|nr:tol-pal system-associated acyl-CoA thioesterase [Thiorhodococcus minor]NEV61215.1 tol-pal system-associated acyl-CoA thioesterase [Thiorhodococcus minor]